MSVIIDTKVDIPESHENCIMCGKNNSRSLGLSFTGDKNGKVTATFQSFSELQGYSGQVHGGIISSLLDSAMTHCLFNRKIEGVTAELTVKFIKPVPYDSRISLTAHVKEKILTLYKLEAELIVNGELHAKAESKFMEKVK